MTLEEAIRHCEEVAERCAVTDGNLKCEMEHRQFAEWLKELKAVQDIIKQHDRDSMPEDYWYIDKIRMEVLK